MKKKSLFTQILLLILIGVVCLCITVGIALLVGTVDMDLFDFKNLNFGNMILVLIIGGFMSCVIVGISVLIVGKNAFFKIQDYLKENDKKDGGTEK